MAFDKTKPAGSDLIADLDTILQANFAVLAKKSLFWLSSYPSTSATPIGIAYTMPTDGTIINAIGILTTAGTVQSTILDIHVKPILTGVDGSIWTTTSNRLTIPASQTTANQTAFDVTTFKAGDIITCYVDQVGTSAAGLTIQLDYELA